LPAERVKVTTQVDTSVVICSVDEVEVEEDDVLVDEVADVEAVDDEALWLPDVAVDEDDVVIVELVVVVVLREDEDVVVEVVEETPLAALTASTNHTADSPGLSDQLPDCAFICVEDVVRYAAPLVCQPFGLLCAISVYPGGAVILGPPSLPIIASTISFGLEVE
jgi:hypothetical protein